MDGSAYFAVSSLVVSLSIGVVMAIHPEWRARGWVVICACAGVLFWSTATYLLAKSQVEASDLGVALPFSVGAVGALGAACAGLLVENRGTALADHAVLRLQFFGDDRIPTKIRQENVGCWFSYFTQHAKISFKDVSDKVIQTHEIPKNWAIYIVFEKPTSFNEVTVGFNAPGLPMYDVMHPNSRAIMVSFRGDIPAGELEISTKK